jgi:AmmeMemoRadiSam system protein B/AmmeMemoRadiSam system protein A
MAKHPYLAGAAVVLVVAAVAIAVWMARREERSETPRPPLSQAQEAEMPEQAPRPKHVFDSPLAGRWYPADPPTLNEMLDLQFSAAEQAPMDEVCALILPHAGYQYSGPIAAYGLKAVSERRPARIVLLGPSHRVPMRGYASLPGATHYRTPLGESELDTAFIELLLQHGMFRRVAQVEEVEHSVQILVPQIQHALGAVPLVPIVVGQLTLNESRAMAGILRDLLDDDTLVIVSSDFTHYGPNYGYLPFRDDIPENLERLDMAAWKAIKSKEPGAFEAWVEAHDATICGTCPILVLLSMLPEDAGPHLLQYGTSGEITNDYENSVSYLSIAFTGSWKRENLASDTTATALPLSQEDKEGLLRLARETLQRYVAEEKMPAPEELGIDLSPAMQQTMGAFVTLHAHGKLRGCIGEIEPRRPLYEAVMAHAVNAGLKDHRFPRVTAAELPELEFEISVLTPPQPVDSPERIVIGRHGMTVEKAGHRAVFLPQIAPQQGWDRDTTLDHLCLKAGLPADAWRQGAAFTVFEAVVFGEATG